MARRYFGADAADLLRLRLAELLAARTLAQVPSPEPVLIDGGGIEIPVFTAGAILARSGHTTQIDPRDRTAVSRLLITEIELVGIKL